MSANTPNPHRRPAAHPSHLAREDENTLPMANHPAHTPSPQNHQEPNGSNKTAIFIGGLVGLTILGVAGFYAGSTNKDVAANNHASDNATTQAADAQAADAQLSPPSILPANPKPEIVDLTEAQGSLAELIQKELALDTAQAPRQLLKQAIPHFGAEVSTPLTPTFDSYITNVEANTSFEQDTCLRIVGTQNYNQVAYLRFDLSGIDLGQVINAALVLTESDKSFARTQADQDSFSIFAAVLKDGSSQEYRLLGGLSWKNAFGIKPGIHIKAPEHFDPVITQALGNLTYLDQGQANQVDDGDLWYLSNRELFDAVRNQNHGNQSLTLVLATSAGKHIAFHSSEGPEGKRPQLLLKFAKP